MVNTSVGQSAVDGGLPIGEACVGQSPVVERVSSGSVYVVGPTVERGLNNGDGGGAVDVDRFPATVNPRVAGNKTAKAPAALVAAQWDIWPQQRPWAK